MTAVSQNVVHLLVWMACEVQTRHIVAWFLRTASGDGEQ